MDRGVLLAAHGPWAGPVLSSGSVGPGAGSVRGRGGPSLFLFPRFPGNKIDKTASMGYDRARWDSGCPRAGPAAEHRNRGETPRRTRRRDGRGALLEAGNMAVQLLCCHWILKSGKVKRPAGLPCRPTCLSRKTCPDRPYQSHGFLAHGTGRAGALPRPFFPARFFLKTGFSGRRPSNLIFLEMR